MSHPFRTRHVGTASTLLLGAVLLALIAFAAGRYSGRQAEREHQRSVQLDAEREAAATFAENLKLGRQAAARQLDAERGARLFAERLAQERRHATLTLPVPACARVADLQPQRDGEQPGAPGVGAAAGGADVGLTADAVRLWNSALAGEDVAAGACRADAAAGEACAADSGLTVKDAWDNQAANALSCRIDRERLTNLIDYLNRTQH